MGAGVCSSAASAVASDMLKLNRRLAWLTIGAWTVVGVGAAVKAGDAAGRLTGQGGTSVHAEAEVAGKVLEGAFARPLGDVFAVTIESPERVTALGPAGVLDTLAEALRRVAGVRAVVTPSADTGAIRVPLVSKDGRSAALLVAFDPANRRLDTLVVTIRTALRSTLARFPDGGRYRVLVTGRTPLDRDERLLIASDSRRGEARILPATFIILVVVFGALGAALLPIGVGALGVPVALVVLGLLTRVTTVSVVAMTIVTMVGLGVGIDYSLLMVSRFREELARSGDPGIAVQRMLATAGRAVVASGGTVVIGFAALLLTPLVETRSVGLAGIVVVAVMVLIAVTLLPAALMLLGSGMDWPRWLASRLAWYRQPTLWVGWASAIARRPLAASSPAGWYSAPPSGPCSTCASAFPRTAGGPGPPRLARACWCSSASAFAASSSRSASWCRCRPVIASSPRSGSAASRRSAIRSGTIPGSGTSPASSTSDAAPGSSSIRCSTATCRRPARRIATFSTPI
jgi:uncharacterized membrane protein YdfJ with MMPL/SSD domain